ncbi:unnamed protein product [Orchesella dallaii]|uniref:TRAF3-interacting protein 1 N-terminal domain-containing protein n=1 Tax=Orchesella dallaii TaxID=48710 RepID=A0ABP1S1V8_9HEXA
MDKDEEILLLQSVGLTQKLLSEHITKPALADKYLIKPPFRFLHEIVTSVIETTGFMKDIFPQSHLKYEKISNVDDKRAFLKTAIDAIESETNQKCEARPSKILSGKEPEKTNDLLQLLAKAITSFKSKDNSKLSGSKGTGSKPKSSQKAVDNKSGSRTKSEVHQDIKRARSRPPVKKLSSHKSTSQENLRREKVLEKIRPDVSSQSKNKLDSKKSIPRNKGTVDDASNRKSVTQLSTPSNKSDESLKSKVSLTSTISPKQVSASKSISKQSLVKKSSSSKLLPVDPRKNIKQVEKVTSQEVTAGSSKDKAKDVKSSESVSDLESTNIIGSVSGKVNQSVCNSVEPRNNASSPTVKSNTGMPPETLDEVPAQRPVTRKKQLQNYNENNDSNVNSNADDTAENVDVLIPATAASEEQEQIPQSPLTPDESTVPATTTTEQEDKNKSGSSSSSACSSSDEAVTEHMNQKISEWKGDSEEVATVESVEDMGLKTGWIPQSNSNHQCKTNSSSFENLDKVFKSRESVSHHCQDDDEISMSRRKVKGSTPSETAMKRPITVMLDNQDDDEDDETFLVQEKMESETDLTLDRLQVSINLMKP